MPGSKHGRVDFIEIFNAAPSLVIAARRLGVTPRAARLRAARLRQSGLPLPLKPDEARRRQERSQESSTRERAHHVQAWVATEDYEALRDASGRVTSDRLRAVLRAGLVHEAHCTAFNALRRIQED